MLMGLRGYGVGTDYKVEGSFSIPDTLDAAKEAFESIKENFN